MGTSTIAKVERSKVNTGKGEAAKKDTERMNGEK